MLTTSKSVIHNIKNRNYKYDLKSYNKKTFASQTKLKDNIKPFPGPYFLLKVNNRPGVAGDVLQTLL